MVQAVILAGGLGTRLRPITETVPKVMLPVNGQPFLAHQFRTLRENGITRVVLCVGYLKHQIKQYFGAGEGWGMAIAYSEEQEKLLGTAGALRQAFDLLEERFFLLNGDTYLPLPYPEVEALFLSREKLATMVVYNNREDTDVRNNVALDRDSMVICYDKPGMSPGLNYVEAGVLALRRDAVLLIPPGKTVSLEGSLYPPLIQRRELAAYVTNHRFYDIGAPGRSQALEDYLRGTAP